MRIIIAVKIVNVARVLTLNEAHQKMQRLENKQLQGISTQEKFLQQQGYSLTLGVRATS